MTEPNNQLAVSQPSSLSLVQQMLSAGVTTPENVAVVRELMQMAKEERAEQAKREYLEAFSTMQAEMPVIVADSFIPNDDGSVRSRFVKYEDLVPQVQPMLTKHGFSVRFDQRMENDRLIVSCTLMHKGGHEGKPTDFSVPANAKGPPKTSEAQAAGSNTAYAQRRAFMMALNIVCRGDDQDARAVGSAIEERDAREIQRRVEAITNKDSWHRSLLQYAGVDISGIPDEPVDLGPYYAKIQTGRLKEVLAYLSETEAKKGVKR